tara:strand:- start:341 stop:661 length:321 start_codon:yes stop_codon:yes gene_type:complete
MLIKPITSHPQHILSQKVVKDAQTTIRGMIVEQFELVDKFKLILTMVTAIDKYALMVIHWLKEMQIRGRQITEIKVNAFQPHASSMKDVKLIVYADQIHAGMVNIT